MQSFKTLLLKNTGVQLAAHGVTLAVGIATSVILSRYLGVERFGSFHYILAFYYFFMVFNDFGAGPIVLRQISAAPSETGRIVGSVLLFQILVSMVCVLAAWGILSLLSYPGELKAGLCLYALILPLLTLKLPEVIFRARLKMEMPSLIAVVNRVLGFAAMLVVVAAGGGIPWLIFVLLAAEAVSGLLIWRWALRGIRLEWKADIRLWREILRPGIALGAAGLCVAVINRADFIMLERMTGPDQLGYYSAAYRLTGLLEAFPVMLMATVFPLMSRYAKEDPARLKRIFTQSTLLLAAAAVPIAAVTLAAAGPLTRLIFGAQFEPTAGVLRTLIFMTVFMYLSLAGGNLLVSLGREKISLCIQVAAAVMNISLNFILIPKWQAMGAALATACVYFWIWIATLAASLYFLRTGKRSGVMNES